MLKNQIIPQLQQLTNLDDFYFQQNGAPPHYFRGVYEYLDEKLSSAWIGRRGLIDWPAFSPDLNPVDFFFWGSLKNKVYSRMPRSYIQLQVLLEYRHLVVCLLLCHCWCSLSTLRFGVEKALHTTNEPVGW